MQESASESVTILGEPELAQAVNKANVEGALSYRIFIRTDLLPLEGASLHGSRDSLATHRHPRTTQLLRLTKRGTPIEPLALHPQDRWRATTKQIQQLVDRVGEIHRAVGVHVEQSLIPGIFERTTIAGQAGSVASEEPTQERHRIGKIDGRILVGVANELPTTERFVLVDSRCAVVHRA